MSSTETILLINSSARSADSYSLPLAKQLAEGLQSKLNGAEIVERDLTENTPPVVNAAWFAAAYTPQEEITDETRASLAASDEIVDEFQKASALVITVPIYNFTVSAQLKLWIDQVCRFGRTFTYTENGPKPLGEDRPCYLVVASGGTQIGSEIDFATGYLKHVLGFIGITNIHIVEADQLMQHADEKLPAAKKQVEEYITSFAA
ncbi:FMN-dependent NADH-azoreductase [Pseudahrensia aquimaris]|uniref:FMN dependent NADH:quinone oxidoreductase n=1 Tax=Pseudahrensia aquimaris TaxID=744461 RepID=A0ABW3FEX5_9HYPH